MRALSIRQPWAWLIVNGHKDIENRSWFTNVRGPLLIHAAKGMTAEEYATAATVAEANGVTLPPAEALERGGIVGFAQLVDCVDVDASPWFFGEWGFVLKDARPMAFRPFRGALGFFDVPPEGSPAA